MDPVSAIGFASAILTFVDFSCNLIKGSYEIYQSASGITTDHVRIGTVLDDLQGVTAALQSDLKGDSPHLKDLRQLSVDCGNVAQELSAILKDMERKEGNKI